MELVDSHCHLDFEVFDKDRTEVVERAKLQGVSRFVIPSVSAQYWERQLQLSKLYPNFFLAFGLHPYFLKDFQQSDLCKLEQFVSEHSPVAIGECGIDSTVANLPLQQQLFVEQIRLANQHDLPLIVHHRKSHHLIFSAFKQVTPTNGGVIHAFSGSLQDANKYIELGFKLGCGGTITYERASKTRGVFRQVELKHILLETDSPDMPLAGQQGKRNESSNVFKVAQCLAEIKAETLDDVCTQTTANSIELFNLS